MPSRGIKMSPTGLVHTPFVAQTSPKSKLSRHVNCPITCRCPSHSCPLIRCKLHPSSPSELPLSGTHAPISSSHMGVDRRLGGCLRTACLKPLKARHPYRELACTCPRMQHHDGWFQLLPPRQSAKNFPRFAISFDSHRSGSHLPREVRFCHLAVRKVCPCAPPGHSPAALYGVWRGNVMAGEATVMHLAQTGTRRTLTYRP